MTPIETFELRPGYTISRVIHGGWQLAGGHGAVNSKTAVTDLTAFCEAGISTFDCADIYTGVEDLIGEFRMAFAHKWGIDALKSVKVHTKFVPNLEVLPLITKEHVRKAIDQSLRRLRTERLDLVQYHWWDYDIPGSVQTALWLKELQDEGKINMLGATNFDTPHMAELLDAGIPLVSMQVQYSLLDARPQHGLIDRCQRNDVYLLCYGSVAGGFLTDHWLGRDEPVPPFENRSLTKYKLIIDDFGCWTLFQQLLRTLREIADRHGTDIATIASRAILDRAQVGAVIVGARNRSHLAANREILELRLTPADLREMNSVVAQRRGPEGDTFTLERDRNGRHGSIMNYNLNEPAT